MSLQLVLHDDCAVLRPRKATWTLRIPRGAAPGAPVELTNSALILPPPVSLSQQQSLPQKVTIFPHPIRACLGRVVLFSGEYLLVVTEARQVRPHYGATSAAEKQLLAKQNAQDKNHNGEDFGRGPVLSEDVRYLRHHVIWQILQVEFVRLSTDAAWRGLSLTQREQEIGLLEDLKIVMSGPKSAFFYSHTVDLSSSLSRFDSKMAGGIAEALQSPEIVMAGRNSLRSTNDMNVVGETSALDGDSHIWQTVRPSFAWNHHMLRGFEAVTGLGAKSASELPPAETVRWFPPMIEGFVGLQRCKLGGKMFEMSLVSRHTTERAGVRMHARGVDAEGAVANFAETEQILDCPLQSSGASSLNRRRISAFLQTRGSIPVTWKQEIDLRYEPKIQIDATTSMAPFLKHFERHTAEYGETVVVNLLKKKGGESALGSSFEQHVERWKQHRLTLEDRDFGEEERACERPDARETQEDLAIRVGVSASRDVKYVSFDLHHVCGTKNFEKLSILEDMVAEDLRVGGYFAVDFDVPEDGGPGSEPSAISVSSRQTKTFRTNCKDCLDRTNLVQGVLARLSLLRQVTDVGLVPDEVSVQRDAQFMYIFRNIWADNGDCISVSYAGTGAIRSHVTRTGTGSYRGLFEDGVNSLVRYYLNNFQDGRKQDALSLLSGTALAYTNVDSQQSSADTTAVTLQPSGLLAAIDTPEGTGVVASAFAFVLALLYRFAPVRVTMGRHLLVVALWMFVWVIIAKVARIGAHLVDRPRWRRYHPAVFRTATTAAAAKRD